MLTRVTRGARVTFGAWKDKDGRPCTGKRDGVVLDRAAEPGAWWVKEDGERYAVVVSARDMAQAARR